MRRKKRLTEKKKVEGDWKLDILKKPKRFNDNCHFVFDNSQKNLQDSINNLSLPNPHSRHPHTRSNAHAGHANLLSSSSQLIQQRRNLSRPSASQRMPKGNSATVGIDLFPTSDESAKSYQSLFTSGIIHTFFSSSPSSLMHQTHWLANASLIS